MRVHYIYTRSYLRKIPNHVCVCDMNEGKGEELFLKQAAATQKLCSCHRGGGGGGGGGSQRNPPKLARR